MHYCFFFIRGKGPKKHQKICFLLMRSITESDCLEKVNLSVMIEIAFNFLFDFPVEAVIRMLLIGKVCVSKFWTFLHLCLRITGQMHIFRLYQDHACPLWPHVWVFFCFKRFISKDIKGKTCKISKGQANQIPIGHKILC